MQHGYQPTPIAQRAVNQLASSQLIDGNQAVLQQALDLLARLDDELFTQAIRALSLSSVGAHLRHCLDFYQSFLAGAATGRINYDQRVREERIEQNRSHAAAKIQLLREGLSRLTAADEHRELEVLLEGSAAMPAASDWSRSSIRRELQFLLSHTIHHYALIAIALRAQGFEPGAGFGVAPSTLQYWSKTA